MSLEANSSQAYVMGLFTDEDRTASVIEDIRKSSWTLEKVHSPVPSHKVLDAMAVKKSKVGYFTLVGGILGFLSGIALATFTSTRWDLIVQGKPIVSLVPFFIVGFEFTILFSVFGNVIGLLTQAELPEFKWSRHYDPRCSGSHFGVVASCEPDKAGELTAFFKEKGAEVTRFDR